MKIFKPLAIISLLIFFIFSSCKKDEALDKSNTDISLVGKWVMTASYQDDGNKPFWDKIEGEDQPWIMEFTEDGKHTSTHFTELSAYKITSPGELLLQTKDDGEWHPFRYFATKSGELIIHPYGGKYVCWDGYGCLIKYRRAN